MMRIVGRKLGLLLLLPAALLLTAWDTRVIKGDTWRSAYFGGESKSLPEHSTISDMALDSLGVGDLFGIRGEAQATLVDINATWFRPDKMNGLPREGDNRKTAVEERLLPPPAQFSGLPDYSYGLADWFNKNTTCPVGGGPEDLAACHDFAGWMGALNSVHFGTQARRMYARYHEIALQRALRARTLRESMSLIEQDRYGAVLREAELQALVYEAYAQHFLQDRWAIGHMWERWNGPDIPSAGHRTMTPGLAIGAIAGLIHGAESVINDNVLSLAIVSAADPMSSPLPGETAARPMLFRHASDPLAPPVPAIGDERLADMRLGRFGAGYGEQKGDVPLDVATQMAGMLECSRAGWAEVIKTFGPGRNGGYGAHDAPLRGDAPAFSILAQETCWDMWATNRSMYVGFVGEGQKGIAALAALRIVSSRLVGDRPTVDGVELPTSELVALAWRMWRRQWVDPNGIDLAQGGLGSLWGVNPGQDQNLPIYAEAVDPDAMPTASPGGVDRQTIFGAMPQAHSDYWCGEDGLALMERLRQSSRPADQQLCQFLGDMAWQGTHPSYKGNMSRQRLAEGKPIRSLCSIRLGRREVESDDPRDPFMVDQGYVNRRDPSGASPAFGERPVANWCARLPVVRLSRDQALRDANIVQILPPDAARLELIGQDFGEKEGQVFLFEADRSPRPRGRVGDWSDRRIELGLKKGELKPGRDYLVEIRTDDGRRSVGLFIVRIRKEDDAPSPPPIAAGQCSTPLPPVPTFHAGSALSSRLGPTPLMTQPQIVSKALTVVRRDYAVAQGPIRIRLIQERNCLLSRMPSGVAAIESRRAAAYNQARIKAAAWYSAHPDDNLWRQACASGWRGKPVEFRAFRGPAAFQAPSEFWTLYGREIDGVLQRNRFFETLLGAWSIALADPARPMAPDGTLIREGYDFTITDPQEVVRRYFRPVRERPLPAGHVDTAFTANVLTDIGWWSSTTNQLTAITFDGVRSHREFENWLIRGAGVMTGDVIDEHCATESALYRPLGLVGIAPGAGEGKYRSPGGKSYSRIGWPGPGAGPGPSPSKPNDASPFAPPVLSAPTISPPTLSRRLRRDIGRRRRLNGRRRS
ncbi:MAG TPA: hypothetical protein PLF78_04035 [Caulobacter sp.]|nr:hypothetical protein [Caulobacter sp.]